MRIHLIIVRPTNHNMSDETKHKVSDLLGIAAVGRAVERTTDSVLSGAEAVLARICLPAAEELGLLLRDKVSDWRKINAAATVQKAQVMLEQAASDGRHAPPRLIMESLTHASWSDNEQVQEMWAGLIASSCTSSGSDDSNWIFINILGQLTPMQAAILRVACEAADKFVFPTGLIGAGPLLRSAAELREITKCSDVQRIDRELDHLRTLGLIQVGFESGRSGDPVADIQPTALALHLYVRAKGSQENPVDFFGLRPDSTIEGSA